MANGCASVARSKSVGNGSRVKRGVAGGPGAAVARSRIAQRACKGKEYDRRIEQIAKKDYPKVALLQQVKAVGELILDLYPDYRRSASIPEEP